MYNTFSPSKSPFKNSSSNVTLRVNANDFGDGYSQCIKDGINIIEEEITLVWDILTISQKEDIISFMTNQAAMPFYYTPPGETLPNTFRCIDWSTTFLENNLFSVSVTMKRVYI